MRLKLSLLLVFIITYSWSQSGSTKTFTGNGTFSVPAGVTSIQVQAWGGGGSGGGASGAPLLLGRGAAGGGGGAYASNTVLVTPGTTLNVVVASQTSGTTGAGTAGGNSTITGFESAILAAGGSGGDANNAGGSPLGGVGGTIAASSGSVRFAGANGGNGNSWNLLGLLLSSGAGGAGASSGGAGGTAVSGLILSNGPGNAGSPPGGAGSGAINSALGASQIGGAGAAGRVIISYSCANFSLTSTAATSVCASAGTTSTVTLTGSAASLPAGNYVVTYNRSSPSATALTANLTVTTAGTGIFTAVGLTTGGSSVITITKLTSETCSSTISSNNTTTITVSPSTVGGTVSGGTAINPGSTSALLTLSGHTGSVVKWQSSVSPFTTWTDIANTNTTYTSGVLIETTQFRAVVQSGICSAENSAPTTVTVNPRPTITLASTAVSRCSTIDGSAMPTTLDYTTTTENPTTYSIVWNASPVNSFVAVNDAVLPTSPITIAIPAGVIPGTYTGTLTVKNANGAVSSPGSTFTVTINETPLITSTGTITSVCSGTSSQNTTLAYSGVTGNPVSYYIDWNSASNAAGLTDQSEAPFTFISGGGVINNIQIPANVAAGTYSGVMYIFNEICGQSQLVTVTILPATVGGAVSGGTTVCSGNTSGELTLSGYTGSIINWQSSVSPFTTWTDINNTEPAYTSNALTETTQFRAVVKNGTCDAVNSGVTTVTVNPSPGITLQQPFSICQQNNASSLDLPYTGVIGSPIAYDLVWDPASSGTFEGATFEGLTPNDITIIYLTDPAPGSYTGTITLISEEGCVSPKLSFTINILALPTIEINTPITSVCTSTNAQNSTLNYSGSTGEATSYSIDWDVEANTALLTDQPATPHNFLENGSDINTIVVPSNVPAGTYNGTINFSNASCTGSHPVSITISPATVEGTVTGGTTIGSGSTSGLLTLSGHTGSVVKWQFVTSPFFAWQDLPVTTTTYTSGPLTETTQFRALVQSGTCTAEYSYPTMVIVEDLPTIALAPSTENRCYVEDFAQATTLKYAETTGAPVTYSVIWDASPANSFVPVTDVTLPASPITIGIPGGTDPGIYTGTLTVKDANGVTSSGSTFTVSVGLLATIITGGEIDSVTQSSTLQNAALSYSGIFGNPLGIPTRYYIDWDQEANDALLADQPITAFAFSSSGGVINNIQIPANVPLGTYTGRMYISTETSCNQNKLITITINSAAPTIAILESANGLCEQDEFNHENEPKYTALAYNGTTGDPVTYSIVWNSAPANNFAVITDAVLPPGAIPIEIASEEVAGIYTGTLTVKDANGLVSTGKTFTLEISAVPAIILDEGEMVTPVCTSTSLQYATLAYSASTGRPTSYSIFWDTLESQIDTKFDFSPNGGTINIEISPNAPAGTYEGILVGTNESCSYIDRILVPISVTINPTPSAPVITQVKQPTNEYPTGDVILGGLPSTGNWSITTDPVTVSITGSGQSKAISGLAPGTYIFTVTNSAGCSSPASDSVVINYPLIERGVSSKSITATEDLESIGNTISIFSTNKVINVETPNQIINQIFIYDVSGTLLYKKDTVSDSKLSIDNLRSANQVLVVKVVLNNNESATRKIIF